MTKAELRKDYKQKRALLTAMEAHTRNVGVLNNLLQYNWNDVQYVHTFLPIMGQHEPDMWSFVRNMQEHYSHIHIVVSRSEPKDCSMQHFLLTTDIELKKNSWGIAEPIDGEQVAETVLDVVLVPLLVADKKGNRVGYGKGFYDRFLPKCRPDCRKIGVSFFEPVERIDDIGPLDVPLDILITPYSTLVFTR